MKKRFLSAFLALCMALALVPAAGAAGVEPYDVYQGDGFYITATPFEIKSPKYTIGNGYDRKAGDRSFHDGLLMVWTDENYDGNYVNRQFVNEINLVDKDGNVILPEGSMMADKYGHIYNYSKSQNYDPSGGVVFYWDGVTRDGRVSGDPLLGVMDLNGNRITDCRYDFERIRQPFSDGAAIVEEWDAATNKYTTCCIDTNGNVLYPLSNSERSLDVYTTYNNGLAAAMRVDWTTREYGFVDKQGNMVLKLFSAPKDAFKGSDYWKMCAEGTAEGYLIPHYGTFVDSGDYGGFSEGYAVCYDLRSGNELDYNFAIIDTSGNVVGTFSDARPCGDVHDGLVRVCFIDNRGFDDGYGFVDITGKVVLRDGRNYQRSFSCGVTVVNSGFPLIDTKGNTVIPEDHFRGLSALGFRDGLALTQGYADSSQPYVLEIHQGTYTGPGRVYNHSQGGEVTSQTTAPAETTTPTDTTTAPALSIPALDNLPRTETYTPGQFSDVSESAWYASSVRTAYELGLVKGSGAGYAPTDPISIAETLVLACRLHNAYFGSPATFEQGSPWYQVYVDYAIANGIISPAGFPNYAAPANRQTYASIMANALPEEALPAINTISGIPDSASVSPSILPAVLKLYSAGILTGSDAKRTFNPGSSIQRSEVAAIVARMAVPAERVRFAL